MSKNEMKKPILSLKEKRTLLGLTIGDKIEWPKPGGGFIKVTIQEILYQPERDGELHR